MTNNFYDKSETYSLSVKELIIEGEVTDQVRVDFSVLKKRSVIVKETLPDDSGANRFTGAFRYDGYSLFDILEKKVVKKSNEAEFSRVIDLYVIIESDNGDKTVFSWGDIFYPNNLHKIIIASDVSRIVPSKTKDLWVLPGKSKIVAAQDLITVRNISNPVKIRVCSFPLSLAIKRDMSSLYCPVVRIYHNGRITGEIETLPENINDEIFEAIFYGRGRGIHSTTPFKGPVLKEIIGKFYPSDRKKLQTGILCFTGIDGYRCAVSYSELFNRNDQQEFLLIRMKEDEDGGAFRIFAACDFFSDRAVKSLSEIHII
ncbi:MAG TPA: hypothetical protein DDW27_04170 [Bacteroidales bacterium]|nr:hypothetical protein [Bacteroidales bacterium]